MNNNKTSWIQIRCTQQEKAEIVRQLKESEKLSEFMLSAAREKMEARENG
tara:strand:- start:3792 stop:3941 length:150 start_codon:yes stop_codon:yes gene_type:complete